MAKNVNTVSEYTHRRIVSSSMEEHIPVSHTVINYPQCYTATLKKNNKKSVDKLIASFPSWKTSLQEMFFLIQS